MGYESEYILFSICRITLDTDDAYKSHIHSVTRLAVATFA